MAVVGGDNDEGLPDVDHGEGSRNTHLMVTAWLWSAVTMTRVSMMLTMETAADTLTWW
jgi:hypothetical protein